MRQFYKMDCIDILDCLDNIVVGLFGVSILIQLTYYLFVYLKVAVRKEDQIASQGDRLQPVSVIVCARNEEDDLAENLALILEQEYPDYEVIVVNDCSEDNTEQLLAEFKQKYSHLRTTIIKNDGSFLNFRKFANTVGIKAAQHEWLLFTYADCRPQSKQWIASMSKYFVEKKDIVLGYCSYHSSAGFLNKWIRYDACFTAMQHFAFALLGKAYSGVGRNLAYRKSLFFANSGFAVHAHVLSDDDGLFVNKASKKHNVAVIDVDTARVKSKAHKTFKEWMWQKSKQIASSRFYSGAQSLGLTLEPLSRAFMWLTFAALMVIFPVFWQYILAGFLLRMIVFMLIVRAVCIKLNEPGILKYAVFFDFVMPFVHLYLFLFNRIQNIVNGRKRRHIIS